MTDSYPANFEIEIDRPRLTMYLRAQWLLGWMLCFGMFGIFLAMGTASVVTELAWCSRLLSAIAGAFTFLFCLGFSVAIASLPYLIFSHRLAARFADELRVTVEGPFLRL